MIYHKVKDLIKYFSESNIPEKENYKTTLVYQFNKIRN